MASDQQLEDFFSISLKSIRQRRMRSWLTMIGIFIGIAAVVALVSLGQGLENAINEEFQELGTDKMFISPAGSLFGAGGVDSLTEDDVELLGDVRGVDEAAGYMMSSAKVEWDGELWFPFVWGVPSDDDQIRLLEEMFPLEEGRLFEEGAKGVAIVGYDYATDSAFDEPLIIGDDVMVNGEKFEVVGSFEEVGNRDDDRVVAIPMEQARDLLDVPERLDSIIVRMDEGEDVEDVEERIKKEMRDERDQDEGEEDFYVQTFMDVIESFMSILNIVTAVLVGIAAISLLIGGIGIMNTMYTSVLERTKDIGIMKAIGAKNEDVLTLFLIESGLLGLAGGVVGVLLGMGLAWVASFLARTVGGFEYLVAQFPWWLIVGALAFSVIVGILSGILPARQASRKNPVDALRYE
ncbi:MAG: ABC transporter permease [Candidatus Woesearchaeota archaeon]